MRRPQLADSDTPDPDRSEGAIRGIVGYNLKRAYIVLHAAAQAAVAEYGLRIPSFSCLSVIVQNPGIAPSVLAESLKIERPNVVVIVDELERNDLVVRRQMKTDRRRFELTATPRGRRIHDKAAEAARQAEARHLRNLTEDEQALFIDFLNRIEASNTD